MFLIFVSENALPFNVNRQQRAVDAFMKLNYMILNDICKPTTKTSNSPQPLVVVTKARQAKLLKHIRIMMSHSDVF